ncbi:AAA family ATPase [Rhodococcus sp. NPDC054953]
MSSMPGGAADKFGNRYEHWWTAYRIADILEGRASRIRFEPPGSTGVGIEFEIEENGTIWAEQVKEASSGGNWTVNRLKNENVLGAAKIQVESGRNFRLVASTAAPDLADLSTRARSTVTLAEFIESLSKELVVQLDNVCAAWSTTREPTWVILKKIYITHHTVDSLQQLTRNPYKLLLSNDPDSTIAELRNFCDEKIHQSANAAAIWSYLESKGFKRRHLVGDQGTISSLRATTDRQERRINGHVANVGLVPRHDSRQVLGLLQAPNAKQVLLLDGPAGHGKSTIATDVARNLEGLGWFVAVARMDSVTATTNTSDKLGVAIGLAESPAVVLAGVAAGSPAAIVIDQLDAVSTYSGRMADSFDAIDELLDEVASTPNVKVVLVVRTVDLESDPRLRRLIANPSSVDRHTVRRLDISDVKTLLESSEITIPTSASTLELLRIPLHLAVFCRLSETAREQEYRTLQSLYDQYTDEARLRIENRIGQLDWLGITTALVGYMSEHEVLTAPATILDSATRTEVHALESEEIVGRYGAKFSFFHESYFDYLFARTFIASGNDLHTFLATSGQFLFRRAQTRQVLEHLAATDRNRFRVTFSELLRSTDIRAHLKTVVVTVLTQLDPGTEDWAAIDDLAWSGTPIGLRLLSLLSIPGWFDAADDHGRWATWLGDSDRVDLAFHQLAFAARERPDRAEALVRPYLGTSEEWRLRLRFMIEWSLSPGLTGLAIELIDRGLLDDARGPIATNSDFWSIVFGLERVDPPSAARLIGAYLCRGLTRAKADGFSDPFASGHLQVQSQGSQVVIDTAEAAPSEFVDNMLPFIIDIALAEARPRQQLLPAGVRWFVRYQNAHHGVDSAVFAGVELALMKVAAEHPTALEKQLRQIRDAESDELRFLACRALTAGQSADTSIEWLLSDLRNLSIGWSDSPRWASRELLEASSPNCSNELFEQLEATLLRPVESTDSSPWTEFGQFELLSAIDRSRMSDEARRRICELQRRFPESAPQAPRGIMVSRVGSPIDDEASTKMKDSDWLRALSKHSGDRTDWSGHVPVGGAGELAQVVGRRANEDPDRFARLALRIDISVPATAIQSIISNVAGKVDVDLLTEVCRHATDLYGSAVGRTVCSAIRDATSFNADLTELIRVHSLSPDPDRELARTEASPEQFYYGGDLYFAGINSTRGQAAHAAASTLFASDEHMAALLPVVERLATDAVLAVRVCAAEGVIAVMNHDSTQAFSIIERLFDAPIEVLDTRPTERLLTYAVLWAPERFGIVLALALDGPDEVAQRAGHVWAVAARHDSIPSAVPGSIHDLPIPARSGAAEVFAADPSGSIDVLMELFEDDDAGVRSSAAGVLRELKALPPHEIDKLVEAFVSSAAFVEHVDDLVGELSRMTTTLPSETITVCERAVAIAGGDLANIGSARALTGRQLVTVVLRLYRQGNEATRGRCLDLVDRLSELNAYGTAEALEQER